MKREMNSNLREALLDGAITLFKEKGVENVTTRELTDLMGMSRSHLYHYFSDWHSLCVAACARFMYGELQETGQELDALTPEDGLQLLIAGYLPVTVDAAWKLYMDIWQLAQHDEAYSTLAVEVIGEWDRLMEKTLLAGMALGVFKPVDAARAARQIGSLVNGYADILAFPTPLRSRDQAIDEINQVVNLLLR